MKIMEFNSFDSLDLIVTRMETSFDTCDTGFDTVTPMAP